MRGFGNFTQRVQGRRCFGMMMGVRVRGGMVMVVAGMCWGHCHGRLRHGGRWDVLRPAHSLRLTVPTNHSDHSMICHSFNFHQNWKWNLAKRSLESPVSSIFIFYSLPVMILVSIAPTHSCHRSN
jgi:hypothetical protein